MRERLVDAGQDLHSSLRGEKCRSGFKMEVIVFIIQHLKKIDHFGRGLQRTFKCGEETSNAVSSSSSVKKEGLAATRRLD